MRIEYIREVRDTYMQIETDEECKNYQMKMVEKNEPEGFLKLTVRTVDGINRMMYRITSSASMEEFFIKKELAWEDMHNLIKSFMKVFDSVERYMIDYDGILLSPSNIFTDGRGNWQFAYYSDKPTDFWCDIKLLFEFIIRRINHKDTKAVTAAYGIYKRICDGNISPNELFDMEISEEDEGIIAVETRKIESVIPEIGTEEVEEKDCLKIYTLYVSVGIYGILTIYVLLGILFKNIRIKNIPAGGYVFALILFVCGGVAVYRWYNRNKKFFVKVSEKQIQIPFEKAHVKVILPSNQENELTTVLTDEYNSSRHILKWNDISGSQEYEFNDMITIIGSDKDRADCVISDKGVSRVHARITNENDRYYIKDMNSTNGTKVNGRELACYELCEIKPNDRIELGNKSCIFI